MPTSFLAEAYDISTVTVLFALSPTLQHAQRMLDTGETVFWLKLLFLCGANYGSHGYSPKRFLRLTCASSPRRVTVTPVQLGVGTVGERAWTPTPVELLDGVGTMRADGTFTGIVSVACGTWHTAAVSSTGDVYAWGWARFG